MKRIATILSMLALLGAALMGCDDSAGDPQTPDSGVQPDTSNPGTDTAVPSRIVKVGLESTPVGATIWVDDLDTGKLTPGLIEVEAGCHDFSLTLENHEQWVGPDICVDNDTDLGLITLDEVVDPPDTLEDFRWLEGHWVRIDDIPLGPQNATVTVEKRADGIYVKGFYPGEDGLLIEKVSEDTFEINTEDPSGYAQILSTMTAGDTEINIVYKDPITEMTYSYRQQ